MDLFRTIRLKTPESVELKFNLAGIGSRALALLVDYLLIGGIILVLLMMLNMILWSNPALADEMEWIRAIQILIIGLTIFVYFIGFEVMWQGQTPGKRYTSIRVIQTNGRPVGLQQALLRTLTRPIDDIAYVGMVMIIFSRYERRLGDWAAGTLVIKTDPVMTDNSIDISEPAHSLAEYITTNADLSQLNPSDFVVVRELLRRRSLMDTKALIQRERDFMTQLISQIQLRSLPPNTYPGVFLEALYLAYQGSYSSQLSG